MKFIRSSLPHLICFYLIIFLIVFPVSQTVLASQTPTVAFIEMIDSNKPGPAGEVRQQIEKQLDQSQQLQVVPRGQVVNFYKHKPSDFERVIATTPKTEADLLYDQIEDLFMGFKNNEALALTDQAIAALKQRPGIRSNLLNTYFIMTQVYWENGKNSEARKCLEEAAQLSLEKVDLDDYMWSPNLQATFNAARMRALSQSQVTDLVVQVKGNKQAPIFVNGIFRGYGPRLTLKIPSGVPQLVTAGINSKATPVQTYGGLLEITDKGTPTKAVAGISKRYDIQADAVELGKAVGAEQVLVVGETTYKDQPSIQWALFDVGRDIILKSDIVPLSNAAQLIAQSISPTSLPREMPAERTSLQPISRGVPTNQASVKPKTKPKSWVFVVAGVVAVGAGTALIMSLGGDEGDESAPSTTTVTVGIGTQD